MPFGCHLLFNAINLLCSIVGLHVCKSSAAEIYHSSKFNSNVYEVLNLWHLSTFPLEPVGDVLNLKRDLFSNEVFKELR